MNRIIATLLCVVMAICILPVLLRPPNHRTAERSRAEVMSARITDAMHRFHKEFGYWPEGSHAEVVRVLRGENEKGHVFLDLPAEKLTAEGEIPDPWGTPYRIFADAKTQRARVHSAGPDGVFADASARSDDHVSHWSAGTAGIPGLPF
jgi:hypothetical protein